MQNIKTFEDLSGIVKSIKDKNLAEKILSAGVPLAKLAHRARSICQHDTLDNKSAKNRKDRIEKLWETDPYLRPTSTNRYSFPIEIYNCHKNNDGKLYPNNVRRLFSGRHEEAIKVGEELGLWFHFKATQHDPAVLILRGYWWKSDTVKLRPDSKYIQSDLKSSENEVRRAEYERENNVIWKAHRKFSKVVTAPTAREIELEGRRLAKKGRDLCLSIDRGLLCPACIVAAKEKGKKEGYVTKSGCIICDWESNDPLVPDLKTLADAFILGESNDFLFHSTTNQTKSGDRHATRVPTRFSTTARWIRRLYRFNGKTLVGVDCVALHNNILAMMLRKAGYSCPLFEGDSHSKIAELLGITRDEAKADISLSYLNIKKSALRSDFIWKDESGKHVDRRREANLKKFHSLIVEKYPEVLRIIESECRAYDFIERNGDDISEHAQFSRVLFHWEAVILSEAIEILNEKGIFCDSTYDCIYVVQDDMKIAADAFNSVLKKYDIPTETKPDKKQPRKNFFPKTKCVPLENLIGNIL